MRLYINVLVMSLIFTIAGGSLMAFEEPDYKVIAKYDNFEIRKYSPYLIAETEVDASFEDATNIAFRILFDYISGKNVKQEKIKMTTPVNQRNAEPEGEKIKMTTPVSQKKTLQSDGKYTINFVIPSKYTLETVPAPRDPRVNIRKVPQKNMAVIKYSGRWTQEKYRKHEEKLIKALEKKGLEIIGDPVFARYNPPFWPSFMRRNEILLEVKIPVE